MNWIGFSLSLLIAAMVLSAACRHPYRRRMHLRPRLAHVLPPSTASHTRWRQGAFVVDTGAGKLADKTLLRSTSSARSRSSSSSIPAIVRITPAANAALAKAGLDPSVTGSVFSGAFPDAGQTATVLGQQNVENHLLDLPAVARPSDTYLTDAEGIPQRRSC